MAPSADVCGSPAQTRVWTCGLLIFVCCSALLGTGHALPHSLTSLLQDFRKSVHAVSEGVTAAQHAVSQAAHSAEHSLENAFESASGIWHRKHKGKDTDEADFADADDTSIRSHWALLIAGSAGWGNYRHQADACHAYQVLRKGGFKPEHMVLMVADDIAADPQNPRPGKIFNRPGGDNVYDKAVVDYRNLDVNVPVLQAVLEGRAAAVKGIGSGRVIASGPRDRVFLFYSDHGAAGVLGMPSGDFLYADQLMASLKYKKAAGGFKEMVLYIEACESGSMFEGLLDANLNIWATTAANAIESSWGTYCPGSAPGPTEAFGTCLGDLYSVAWMENSEEADLRTETLKAQYELVRLRSSDNGTFNMGSHVMRYGQMGIQREAAGDYIGTEGHPAPTTTVQGSPLQQHHQHSVPQREADLMPLRQAVLVGRTPAVRAAAQAQLAAVLADRQQMDDTARAAATRLFTLPGASQALMKATGWSYNTVFMTAATSSISSISSISSSRQSRAGSRASSNMLQPAPLFVEDLVTGYMGRPSAGLPLVDDWGCLREMVQQWQRVCGRPMDQYAMRHTRFFANLCNHGVKPMWLAQALHGAPCTERGTGAAWAGLGLPADGRQQTAVA